jgi:hypothetical protein
VAALHEEVAAIDTDEAALNELLYGLSDSLPRSGI